MDEDIRYAAGDNAEEIVEILDWEFSRKQPLI